MNLGVLVNKEKDLKIYINLIRRTVIGNSFLLQYFLKIVVVYMLANNVTTWVAVSIPVVLEFSQMLSRGFKRIVNIAINTNYKKYHLTYLLIMGFIFLIISQSHNVIIIYMFTIILGFLSGINASCITRINTSNKNYESYCLMEEERSSVIGATLGLIISQIFYDLNPLIYILGFIIFSIMIFIFNYNVNYETKMFQKGYLRFFIAFPHIIINKPALPIFMGSSWLIYFIPSYDKRFHELLILVSCILNSYFLPFQLTPHKPYLLIHKFDFDLDIHHK